MKLAPISFTAALFLATAAIAAGEPQALNGRIDALAVSWAHANYETHDKGDRAEAAAKVVAEAAAVAAQYPGRAEPLVWEAIASATEGGAKGGLGGLALAKQAKQLLERAEAMNPQAMPDGSVYTSLGSLYAQVPGFPVGFGDPAKARGFLLKALAMNPTGIDPNFFYGDYLARQGDYAGAAKALERALAAPARPGRELADHGRRAEVTALLTQVRAKAHG